MNSYMEKVIDAAAAMIGERVARKSGAIDSATSEQIRKRVELYVTTLQELQLLELSSEEILPRVASEIADGIEEE